MKPVATLLHSKHSLCLVDITRKFSVLCHFTAISAGERCRLSTADSSESRDQSKAQSIAINVGNNLKAISPVTFPNPCNSLTCYVLHTVHTDPSNLCADNEQAAQSNKRRPPAWRRSRLVPPPWSPPRRRWSHCCHSLWRPMPEGTWWRAAIDNKNAQGVEEEEEEEGGGGGRPWCSSQDA